MAMQLKKRGRPRKQPAVVQADADLLLVGEKTPSPASLSSRTGNTQSDPATSTSICSPLAGDNDDAAACPREGTSKTKSGIAARKAVATAKTESDRRAAPPAVIATIASEKSKILSQLEKEKPKIVPALEKGKTQRSTKTRSTTSPSAPKKTAAALPLTNLSPPAFLDRPSTLAMGLPIPSFQSSTHALGLPRPHLVQWLPNPPLLPQSAHFSLTTRLAAKQLRKPVANPTTLLREANRFAVSEESSRSGPGAGAERSRAAAERVGLRPSDPRSPQYKAKARRILSIMVALPIAIVTSWMVYQRLVLGVEPKVRHPGGSKVGGEEVEAEGKK